MKAIEAGARAVETETKRLAGKLERIIKQMERTGDWRLSEPETRTILDASKMLAAIASGELVPASAVAAERGPIARAKDALFNIARIHGYRLNDVELSEGVRAVLRALSPEPASGEWRDISTAPKDGTAILLFSNHQFGSKTPAVCSWWTAERCAANEGGDPGDYIAEWYLVEDEYDCFCRPTHWMPLPEPPAMLNAATKDGERA